MAQDRYGIYSASLGDLDLVQLLDTSIDLGATFAEIVPGGSIDRGAVILNAADPKLMFRTGDLDSVLAEVSPTVGLITATSEIRCQKRADGGVFASGSNHITLGSTKGWANLAEVAASQDDQAGAVASLEWWPLFDGTNHPLTYAAAASLAADPAPAFTSQYFLGPVYVGSTQIEGVTRAAVQLGCNYRPVRADGDTYARVGFIQDRAPLIRLQFAKMTNIASVTSSALLAGAALGDTLSVFFRKGTASGVRVADASSAHVEFQAAAGHWHVNNARVDGQADYALELVCRPTGTIAVATGAAIP